ncbi:MAG TPA: tetratricopeptide repeat protein [Polyangia bacterium]|jgi:TolA-binding protein
MKSRRLLVGLALATTVGLGVTLVIRLNPRSSRPAGSVLTQAGPLQIRSLTADPVDPTLRATVRLTATVLRRAPARGALKLTWEASGGTVSGTGTVVTWQAPGRPGSYRIAVRAEDGEERAEQGVVLTVRFPDARRGEHPVRMAGPDEAKPTAAEVLAKQKAHLAEVRAKLREKNYGTGEEHRTLLKDLALSYMALGDYEGALEAYYVAIQTLPLDGAAVREYRVGYGQAALALGRDDEALEAFLDAGAENGADTFFALGELLERRGRTDEAITAYQSATERSTSGLADAAYRAARLQLARGDEAGAVGTLVGQSAAVGNNEIQRRLREDPTLAPLRAALERSGRTLGERQAIRRDLPGQGPALSPEVDENGGVKSPPP